MRIAIAELCQTYDRSQEAARDPSRRDDINHQLEIIWQSRKRIESLVSVLMEQVSNPAGDDFISEASKTRMFERIATLTYFNTWFNSRGGWS